MGNSESTLNKEQSDASGRFVRWSSVALVAFVFAEVNYPQLRPQSQLAIFAALGIAITLVSTSVGKLRWANWALAGAFALTAGWIVVQTEPAFSTLWSAGSSLGNRAGAESSLDLFFGAIGLVVVMVAAKRKVGWALPILAMVFLAYAYLGPSLPDFLLPHKGYGLERIVSQTFLQTQGVFGIALRVMFSYVFLFVFFGALLETSGATQFIIRAAQNLFEGTTGGAAKVSVLSSGLMGSLSGSAVANTATTGTFTIPLMRSSGFKRDVAAGVEAAASSGGALVPPVMGAGAYMMLEIVEPAVTYLEIVRAALIPAILYYLSLFMMVHLYAKRVASEGSLGEDQPGLAAVRLSDEGKTMASAPSGIWPGVLFVVSLAVLMIFLGLGYTVFRSVTVATVVLIAMAMGSVQTRFTVKKVVDAAVKACRAGVALISAASCVGIVIGVVTLTGVGTKLPGLILPLAEQSLMLALLLLMGCSILLGMGLPSAVCYLLMATLIGPVIGELGIVPLSAHFFIFYFGMMSMVTPPVALAAYTAASIADSGIMRSAFAAFRFALAGFTLPFLFVLRPELLLLSAEGDLEVSRVVISVLVAALGLVPLAAAIAGFLRGPLRMEVRVVLFGTAVLMLWPGPSLFGWTQVVGLGIMILLSSLSAELLASRNRSPEEH